VLTVANARAWAKWVAARYRRVPTIVWSLSPEASPEFVPILRELAAGLRQGDGGAHLITVHPDPAPCSSSFLHDEPWLDFHSIQTWKSVELIHPYVTRDYGLRPPKPVVMAEGAYERGSEYGFDVTPLWVRRQAYASSHAILRDTPAGPRYLEPTPDGGRVVNERLNTDNFSLLGGVLYNQSLDFPIPLVGFNYFNRDIGGSGIQTNVLYGGVLLVATAGKPRLGGTPFELSADLYAQGFSGTDQPVRDGEQIEREGVDLTNQEFTLAVGLPFADYWKVKMSGSFEYEGFSHDKDTARRFVIPTDTMVSTLALDGEFNRSAWTVRASAQTSRRSRWECWGFCDDPNFPTSDRTALRDARDYVRYEGAVSKDFYLPLGQKILTTVAAYGGGDLDRFSQYKFGSFSNRLRGFSGSGIRYTNGGKATAQYAFNLGSVIRFDATVDYARVVDRLAPGGDDVQRFTGFGLSGQTILGPNLIVQLDWGMAIGSSVAEYRGDQEVFITILRLFR